MSTIPELLDRKRWGGRLTRDELEALVGGYVRGEVPDYQVVGLADGGLLPAAWTARSWPT